MEDNGNLLDFSQIKPTDSTNPEWVEFMESVDWGLLSMLSQVTEEAYKLPGPMFDGFASEDHAKLRKFIKDLKEF